MSDPLTQAQTEAITDALAAGQKIQAIKLYREYTGKGLKEAKDFVEALEPELRKRHPERFAHQRQQGKGCATMVLVCLAVGILVWIA